MREEVHVRWASWASGVCSCSSWGFFWEPWGTNA